MANSANIADIEVPCLWVSIQEQKELVLAVRGFTPKRVAITYHLVRLLALVVGHLVVVLVMLSVLRLLVNSSLLEVSG